MSDMLLMVIVVGVVAIAAGVDVAVAVGLARRWVIKIGGRR